MPASRTTASSRARAPPKARRPRAPQRPSSTSPPRATLAANGLKTLEDGTILESQAQLAAGLAADWDAAARATAEALLARLGARERAKTSHVLRVHHPSEDAIARAGVSVLARAGDEVSLLCPRPRLMEAMAALGTATVHDVDYVFDGTSPLYAKLEAAIAATPGPP